MDYEKVVTNRVDAEVVTLDDVKSDLDVTHSEHDVTIGDHIVAAIDWVETHTNLYLQPVTILLHTGSLTGRLLRLPGSPIRSVTSILVDGAAVEGFTTIDGASYTVLPPEGSSWPFSLSIAGTKVIYEAGYAEGTVPAGLKAIIKEIVSIFYDKPTGPELTSQWNAVERALTPYRVRTL